MIIHVVEDGDTIHSIAALYEVSASILIQENALSDPDNLVVGQCIVITFPALTYTVQEGDTLGSIADSHNITIIQLYQNNPYLSDRDYIYPGDRIVISYDKEATIATHGNAVPYINQAIYRKTLPYLTYLSVVNYTITDSGEIITHYDDAEFIQIAKEYNVMPLMFLTTLTLQGEANIRTAYELLLSEELQDRLVDNIIAVLREKGFYGVNMSTEYVSAFNLPDIERAYSRTAARLKEEGFLVFITINPNITVIDNEVVFNRVDFTEISNTADKIVFMNYEWARKVSPPSPISSIYQMEAYLDFLMEAVPTNKLSIGMATIGYNWALPFMPDISSVSSLSLESAIGLARDVGATIHFDEISQTPFYRYTDSRDPLSIEHIVWFLDARSFDALLKLVSANDLQGTGIWNITVYNTQLWLILNSQYEIEKYEVE